jgi:hypothetical protein
VIQGSVAQYGADYFDLAISQGGTVEFAGVPTVPVVAGSAGGTGEVRYSGRADSSNATLTRRFDLAGLGSATLSYRVWYDIERDFDFLYISVSSDEGGTWTLLATPSMSRANLSGNNLGVGYTGRSGEAADGWIREEIDLTPYVGGAILLRFSYITDDSILREGVLVDDIAIDAIGYTDTAQNAATWQSVGWSTGGALLPQIWSLQAIEWHQGEPKVTQVSVDAAGNGVWSPSGPNLDRAVLIVSAVTPVTLQRASYSLIVRDKE